MSRSCTWQCCRGTNWFHTSLNRILQIQYMYSEKIYNFFAEPDFPLSPCQFQVPVTGTKCIYPYVRLTLEGYMEQYLPPPRPPWVFVYRIKFSSSINLLSLLGTYLFQAGLKRGGGGGGGGGRGVIERRGGLFKKGRWWYQFLIKNRTQSGKTHEKYMKLSVTQLLHKNKSKLPAPE